jgi:hypothetical protein
MLRAIYISRESAANVGYKVHSPKVVQLKPHDLSQARSHMFTGVTLVVLSGWITASLVNDFLFLKETLVSSFIIVCLLFMKRSDDGKEHQGPSKKVYDLSRVRKANV